MTIPCREQILAAVLARLVAIGGVTAERERHDAIDSDDLAVQPSIVLFDGDETDVTQYSGEDCFELSLDIQATVTGADAAASTVLNTLAAKVSQALRSPSDFTIGGLARDVQINGRGADLVVDVNAPAFTAVVIAAAVQYATVEGDPFTFADA